MRLRTKKFLREKFKGYYSNKKLKTPPKLEDREWGIILLDENFPEKTVMKRHKSFSSRHQVVSYLESMIPAHVYFSSAYYKRPNASVMEEKGWKGADLVFDLDADHLTRSKNLEYKEMLEEVKKETKHLLNDFLIDDLGINRKNIQLVFSGGRGYHIHIRKDEVLSLNSQERREIIDYIFGRGIKSVVKQKERKGIKIPYLSSKQSNWNEKIKRYIINDFLKKLSNQEDEKAKKDLLNFKGIGEKTAERIINALNQEGKIKKIKQTGKLDIAKGIPNSFWKKIVEEARKEIKAEADEPVTSDIKRLIRLPTSLHGGTGFKVTPIPIDKIEKFNPFEDAVVFKENPVRIYSKEKYKTVLNNKEIRLEKDEIKTVPEYAAIFLSCIGKVEVEGW